MKKEINKPSFCLYNNMKSTFDLLTDEQAGQLIKHIFSYVCDEDPTPPDKFIEVVFEPIKQVLKMDLKKYEARVEANKTNGKKGSDTRWKK